MYAVLRAQQLAHSLFSVSHTHAVTPGTHQQQLAHFHSASPSRSLYPSTLARSVRISSSRSRPHTLCASAIAQQSLRTTVRLTRFLSSARAQPAPFVRSPSSPTPLRRSSTAGRPPTASRRLPHHSHYKSPLAPQRAATRALSRLPHSVRTSSASRTDSLSSRARSLCSDKLS